MLWNIINVRLFWNRSSVFLKFRLPGSTEIIVLYENDNWFEKGTIYVGTKMPDPWTIYQQYYWRHDSRLLTVAIILFYIIRVHNSTNRIFFGSDLSAESFCAFLVEKSFRTLSSVTGPYTVTGYGYRRDKRFPRFGVNTFEYHCRVYYNSAKNSFKWRYFSGEYSPGTNI